MSSLAAGLGVLGDIAGTAFDFAGQLERDKRAQEALRQQQQLVSAEQSRLGQAQRRSLGELSTGAGLAEGTLHEFGGRAQQQLGRGFGEAGRVIGQGLGAATGAAGLQTGQAITDLQRTGRLLGRQGAEALTGARGDVLGGLGGAEAALQPAVGLQALTGQAAMGTGPVDAQSGIPEALGGELSRDQAFAGFEADPGFQFRLQQGEQAINRAAAARGGRLSGETLKALQAHGQGLASDEFGRFAARRQGLDQLRGQLMTGEAQRQLGQAGLTQQAELAQRGRQLQLAQAGLGAGSNLAALRAGTGGQLASQGLGMFGQQAGLQAGLGGQAAGLRAGLGSQLAGLHTGAAQQQAGLLGQRAQLGAGLSSQRGAQLAALQQGLGQARAGVRGGTAAQQAQLGQSLLPAFGGPVATAAAPFESVGQGLSSLGGNLSFAGLVGGGQPAAPVVPGQQQFAGIV